MTKKASALRENQIDDSIYTPVAKNSFRYTIIICSFLLIGFLSSFPIKEVLKFKIAQLINQNNACPISYKDLDLSLLMPELTLKSPIIAGSCFGKPSAQIAFKSLIIAPRPHLSPLGIKLNIRGDGSGIKLRAFPLISSDVVRLALKDTIINVEKIKDIINMPIKMVGDVKVDIINAVLKNGKITRGQFKIESNNFDINGQKVRGLILPAFNLKGMSLKAELVDSKKLMINRLELGNKKSDVFVQLEGNIALHQNMAESRLNLQGKIGLSSQFEEKVPLMPLLLPGKKPVDGAYVVKIQGKIGKPQFQ